MNIVGHNWNGDSVCLEKYVTGEKYPDVPLLLTDKKAALFRTAFAVKDGSDRSLRSVYGIYPFGTGTSDARPKFAVVMPAVD